MKINASIHILGVARNVSPYLHKVFANLINVSKVFQNTQITIVESDSDDGSYRSLKKWENLVPNTKILSLGKLRKKITKRTERIAYVRNITWALRNKDCDYFMWVDLDNVNAGLLDCKGFSVLSEAPSDWGIITASQDDDYYDIWALRHTAICNFDCIEEIKKAGWENKDAHEKYVKVPSRRIVEQLKTIDFLKVDSAFGGMSIIRNIQNLDHEKPFIGVKDSGDEVCEWVTFNNYIRQLGVSIYIAKKFQVPRINED